MYLSLTTRQSFRGPHIISKDIYITRICYGLRKQQRFRNKQARNVFNLSNNVKDIMHISYQKPKR